MTNQTLDEAKEYCVRAFDIYKEKQFASQHYSAAEIQAAAVVADQTLDDLIAKAQQVTREEIAALTCRNGLGHYCPNCDNDLSTIVRLAEHAKGQP